MEPFCEIDADALEAAKGNPTIGAFAAAADAYWRPVKERITNGQVRKLQELLSLPSAPPVDFDYFAEDE